MYKEESIQYLYSSILAWHTEFSWSRGLGSKILSPNCSSSAADGHHKEIRPTYLPYADFMDSKKDGNTFSEQKQQIVEQV